MYVRRLAGPVHTYMYAGGQVTVRLHNGSERTFMVWYRHLT